MAYPFEAAEVLTAVDLNAMIGAPTQNAITTVTYTAVLLDAGKTVTLSNASAVTLTIPAQASVSWADNTQLNFLNLGAGTVTITPAAGVTINGTPLTLATSKGGSLVRTASNTWTFTPTGGGDSPGLNPVAPTSIANSGGSASTTLSTTTFTGVTTVSLNGVFTSNYTNYRIITTFTTSVINDITYRLRVSGVDNAGAGAYFSQRILASSTTLAALGQTESFAVIGAAETTRAASFAVDIFRPQQALTTNWASDCVYSTSNVSYRKLAGTHNVASGFDGMTLIPSAGNITGTITIYGYAK